MAKEDNNSEDSSYFFGNSVSNCEDEIKFSDAFDTWVGQVPIDEQKSESIKEIKCFVMMPSGKKNEYSRTTLESQYIYRNIIRPAVHLFAKNTNKNIKTLLEIEDHFTGSIAKSIIKHIAEAEICIVDITGHNPNVFFELGVRYSLRNKTTILLKQNSDNNIEIIPFDIQGYRCMTYDCLEPFEAIKKLYGFLLSSDNDSFKTDSLVFEVFKDMEVRIPNVLTSTGESYDHLSWNELWEQIKRLASKLEELHRQHDIHLILGITNGGLIVADLIGRLAFRDIPILALWADRRSRATIKDDVDRSCYFFDNEYNKAIMKSIKEKLFKCVDPNHKIGIMLVDDLIYTSNTCLQAKFFLERELEGHENEYDIIFSPLYCRRSSEIPVEEIKDILITNYIEKPLNDKQSLEKAEEYLRSLHSDKRRFPYDKDLY